MEVDEPKDHGPPGQSGSTSDEGEMEVDPATATTTAAADLGNGDSPTNEDTQRSTTAPEELSSVTTDEPAAAGESNAMNDHTEETQRTEKADEAEDGDEQKQLLPLQIINTIITMITRTLKPLFSKAKDDHPSTFPNTTKTRSMKALPPVWQTLRSSLDKDEHPSTFPSSTRTQTPTTSNTQPTLSRTGPPRRRRTIYDYMAAQGPLLVRYDASCPWQVTIFRQQDGNN